MADKIKFTVVAPVSYILGSRNLKKIPIVQEDCGIDIFHPRCFNIPKYFKGSDGTFLHYFTKKCVEDICKTKEINFIDAHYAYPDGYAAMLHAKENNLPYFLTVRGSDLYLLAKKNPRKKLIKVVLSEAAGITAVSESLKHLAIELGANPNKIAVIGNGVNNEKFSPDAASSLRSELGIPTKAKVIMCVGRLVELKRFDLMIKTVFHLTKSNNNSTPVHGIIVGKGPEHPHLLSLAKQLGIEKKIHFVGEQHPGAMPEWFNTADVLLVLSTHEGSPNAPLEALSCGTPVIATGVGNLPEIISPDNGYILKNLKIKEIAESIKGFARMEPKLRKIVSKSVKDCSWDSVGNSQVSFIEDILNI